MSALFMSRHRYSTINPEDIARFGGRRTSLNSISFRNSATGLEEVDEEAWESDEDLSIGEPLTPDDEERTIGFDVPTDTGIGESRFKRQASSRQSTRSTRSARGSTKRYTVLSRLYRKWKRIYRQFGFRHIIPVALLVAYSIMGALIFQAIEGPHAEIKKRQTINKLESNRQLASTAIIADLRLSNSTEVNDRLWAILEQFERNNSLPIKETITWDIWGSLFYCGTIYTTVGYGNIYPETTAGWICTIIYAFFGVPLLLAILSDIGQLLCMWIDQAWRSLTHRFHKARKEEQLSSSSPGAVNGSELSDEGAPRSGAPVTVALLLTFAWLLMCAALFCLWERNWSYFTAFYFFFISLSTIGLGDIVPDHPMLMVVNFGFLIIGLCLVSMTIGVVQEHIELFLYRVMIALQKECEQMLANGEDVEKKELVKKIWNRQPWYVKRLMPAFVGGPKSKRLNDFAAATITDTAVQMGLIPPPPGYRHHGPLPSGPVPPLPSLSVQYTKPGAEHTIIPSDEVAQAISGASTTLAKPIFPKIAKIRPRQRLPSTAEFLPGGHAIISRAQSSSALDTLFTPTMTLPSITVETIKVTTEVQTDLSDLPMRKETVSNISLASCWLENGEALFHRGVSSDASAQAKEIAETFVQTDLTGTEIVVKMETLSNVSLSSWGGEGDDLLLPSPMRPMQTFAADDLLQFRDVAKQITALIAVEDATQTDADPVRGSTGDVSEASEEFESANETRSTWFSSKAVQVAIVPEGLSEETQTDPTDILHVEVQTSVIPSTDTEVQCQAVSSFDQEVQTVPWPVTQESVITNAAKLDEDQQFFDTVSTESAELPLDPITGTQFSVEPFVDNWSQTFFEVTSCDVEMQTVGEKCDNQEMQTDPPTVLNAETQTTGQGHRLSLQPSFSEDEEEDESQLQQENKEDPPVNMIWSYNAWFSDDRRKKKLDSVPEEEDTEDEDLHDEEFEMDRNEKTEDDGALPSTSGANDRANRNDKFGSSLTETGIQTDDDGYSSLNGSVSTRSTQSVACQTPRVRLSKGEVITAAIATQTEEMLERRNTYPRRSQARAAEATIAPNRRGGTFRARWTAWKEKHRHNEPNRFDQKKKNVAIQTEGYTGEGVRDIVVQTDDSYLKSARRLEELRTVRARSLRIHVSPIVKQRLNRMVTSSEKPSVSSISRDK